MMCHDATLSLGAYVLGALDPDERADLERHLHACPACRDDLAEIAGMPGLLGKLTLEDIKAELPSPPEDLYHRLAGRADEESVRARGVRRRHRLVAAAAGVVLLAGVGAGIGAWEATRPDPSSYAATAGRVHMTVKLTDQATGTGLDVTVSGLPAGERCRLVAVAHDGTRDIAGAWAATYTGHAWVKGSTSIPSSQLEQLLLLSATGQQLVGVRV
jgi:predicted anti-sigma-YlaC factor YlaD